MIEPKVRAALYARVSTDQQEKEATIQSQVEALRKYAHEKGYQIAVEYLDDGYSGSTLARPGLDSLRDSLTAEDFDVLLIHSPDRLARKAVYLGILKEEFQKYGIKLEFLNFKMEETAEGDLLFGMQGLFAEYERAKMIERTRRGKLYWARQGALVGGHAPYGYNFIRRTDSDRAHLEINEYKAAAVRLMYRWHTEDKATVRAIAKRLSEQGIPTSKGAFQWHPTVVHRILTNSVYKGTFEYHHSEQEHVSIPVPLIVDESTWEAVQQQLRQNRLLAARNNKRHQYLLRGLIRCPRCGGTYTGYFQRGFRGYKCHRAHYVSSSTGKRCRPGAVPAGPVEMAVWEAVKDVLRRPELLVEEYKRRLAEAGVASDWEFERKKIKLALRRAEGKIDKLTDAYLNDALELPDYKSKMEQLRAQRAGLQSATKDLDRREQQEDRSRSALDHLQRFCNQVAQGLDAMTFGERQQLLRLVVERIAVEGDKVQVETIIPTEQHDVKLCHLRGELVEPCRGLSRQVPSIGTSRDQIYFLPLSLAKYGLGRLISPTKRAMPRLGVGGRGPGGIPQIYFLPPPLARGG